MARVLIVGCGCRGRALAQALAGDGHEVRGTSRTEEGRRAIAAAGFGAAAAEPLRLATLMPHLEGIAALCWLMGTAEGEPGEVDALHSTRLTAVLEKLVDTHVRGAVYEAGGTVPTALRAEGARAARAIGARFRMPVEVVDEDPAALAPWLAAMRGAVGRVLAAAPLAPDVEGARASR